MIAVSCPECDGKLVLKDAMAGRPFTCPDCEAEFNVPRAAAPDDDEERVPRTRAFFGFFLRRWELFGCMALCSAITGAAPFASGTHEIILVDLLLFGTIFYAAFYRRLMHPFVGVFSIVLVGVMGIVAPKLLWPKPAAVPGNAPAAVGTDPQLGDLLKQLGPAMKNIGEANKLMKELTDDK